MLRHCTRTHTAIVVTEIKPNQIMIEERKNIFVTYDEHEPNTEEYFFIGDNAEKLFNIFAKESK